MRCQKKSTAVGFRGSIEKEKASFWLTVPSQDFPFLPKNLLKVKIWLNQLLVNFLQHSLQTKPILSGTLLLLLLFLCCSCYSCWWWQWEETHLWVWLRLSTAPCVSSDTQAGVQLCFPLIVTAGPKLGVIIHGSFCVVCSRRKVGQGNGCFMLCSQRRGIGFCHQRRSYAMCVRSSSRSTFVSSFVWVLCIEDFPGTTPNHSLSLEGFDHIIHCFPATQQYTVCPLKYCCFFYPSWPFHTIATAQYC